MGAAWQTMVGLLLLPGALVAQSQTAGAAAPKSRAESAAPTLNLPFAVELDAETLRFLQEKGKLKVLPKGSQAAGSGSSMSRPEMAPAIGVVMLAGRPVIAQYPGEFEGADDLRRDNEALKKENKLLKERVSLLEQKIEALQGRGDSK
jgi:hypothetical protein